MQRKLILTLLCSICAALPGAAQTAAPEDAPQSTPAEDMVLIPAGKFWMGRAFSITLETMGVLARDRMDTIPANHISLDDFYIDRYEVVQADYARFLADTGPQAPWNWPQGEIPDGEEQIPVYNVNWYEATDYCRWTGKRLPTEAEWEKAARGGLDRARYAWGDDDIDTSEFRVLPPQSSGTKYNVALPAVLGGVPRPEPGGSFPPNGYGLYDMIGNVAEWVDDWYHDNYYPFMPKVNPQGPESGFYKSLRGSSFRGRGAFGNMSVSVHMRDFSDPELRTTAIGFRCAKDAS